MLKMFQKRARQVVLALCLSIALVPVNGFYARAEEKAITFHAQEGITFENGGTNLTINFSSGDFSGDSVGFVNPVSGEGITQVRIDIDNSGADATVWIPEELDFKMTYHAVSTDVRLGGQVLATQGITDGQGTYDRTESTYNSGNNLAFQIERHNSQNGNHGGFDPVYPPVNGSICLELCDPLGNNLSYHQYHDYEEGWFMDARVTLEYSYDNSEWHELSNFPNDANLTEAHYMRTVEWSENPMEWWAYCFEADKVYLRYADMQGAMKGMDSNFTEGRLVKGEVYELTQKDEDMTYSISLDNGIRSLDWIYDMNIRPDAKEDMLVTNGKAYVIKVGDLTAEEYARKYDSDHMGNTKDGGYWRIEEGTEVTVQLIPDYGYQIAGAALNGMALVPLADKSTFAFTMPANQLHFSAMFVQASDKINTTSSDVRTGSISGAGNVVDTGNVQLDVADLNVSAQERAAFEERVGGDQIVKYLDLGLYNIVYKNADGSQVWSDKLEELDEKVTLTLQLADTFAAQSGTYYIIREHKGVYDELPATYNASARTLTFDTDKFSDYAIAVKSGEENSDSSDDSDDDTPASAQTTLVAADSNTAGQTFGADSLTFFASDTTVKNVAGAVITAVSADTAQEMIAEAGKIAGENTFIASIVDLDYEGSATFTIHCSNVWKGQSVTILHRKSDGRYERIKPDKVDDNEVTFTMTSYSPIAVVIDTGKSSKGISPKTGESAALWETMVAVLSGLGAVFCAVRAKRRF